MDIQALRYFKVVAEIGNMSRAALELHVSQPTLTVNIKKLEEELGASLFERSKKGVILTPAGLDALRYTDTLLQNWADLKKSSLSAENEVKGLVQFGVHPSVARYTLPKFLPELLKKHPELRFNLHHDLSRNVLGMIVEHRCDVGLVINPEPHADLVIKELLQDEVRVWKKKGSKNNDILLVDENLFQSQTLLDKLKKKNIKYLRTIRSSNLEVLASLLETGMGHVILPERVARQASVQLEEALPEVPPFKDSLNLVYRAPFRKTALGKAVIDAILSQAF